VVEAISEMDPRLSASLIAAPILRDATLLPQLAAPWGVPVPSASRETPGRCDHWGARAARANPMPKTASNAAGGADTRLAAANPDAATWTWPGRAEWWRPAGGGRRCWWWAPSGHGAGSARAHARRRWFAQTGGGSPRIGQSRAFSRPWSASTGFWR